jgi:tetratricopeptide (TPR) repeat protein
MAALLRAEHAELAGDLGAALTAVDEAVAADPGSAFLHLRRGQWRLQRGDAAGSLLDAQVVLDGAMTTRWHSGAALLAARALRELKQPEQALVAWRRAVRDSAQDPSCRRDDCAGIVAHEELMDAMLAAGDDDGAVAYAEATTKLLGGSGRVALRAKQQLARALLLHARGVPAAMKRAASVQSELLALNSDDEQAQRMRLHTLLLEGDDQAAMAWLSEMARSDNASSSLLPTWVTVTTLTGGTRLSQARLATDVDAELVSAAIARGGQPGMAASWLLQSSDDSNLLQQRRAQAAEWWLSAHAVQDAMQVACADGALSSWCARARVEDGQPMSPLPKHVVADETGALWADAWTVWLATEPPGQLVAPLTTLGQSLLQHPDHRLAGASLLGALGRDDLIASAIQVDVDDASSTLLVSSHLERTGKLEEAFMVDANHLRDHDTRAVKNHAAYLVAEHPQPLAAHLDEAKRWAWQLVVDDPLSGALMDTWGWVLLQSATTDDEVVRACTALERANQLLPHQAEILVHVATCWHRAHNSNSAQQRLQQARAALHRTDRYRAIVEQLETQWQSSP